MLSKRINRPISFVLIIAMLLSTTACSGTPTNTGLSDPNGQLITEHVDNENKITENTLTEFITSEIYLEEFVIVENEIAELLLEEEMIDEVTMCKTIYVPEGNIDDFAEHSQTSRLFGEGFDIKPALKKVAIGTGVIVTIAIVKKVNVPKPIASIVFSAADESLKFAASGAVVGTIFGAFTGAVNEIDEAERAASVTGFALATVGLIITGISLVEALVLPIKGGASLGIAEGVHMAWAGVQVILAASGMTYAARNTVKSFTTTDVSEINWDHVDWDKVGVSAAQKAIQNGADGYMWGSIYGMIDGTVDGYYHKYCTPYTKYKERLKKVPKDGERGHWTGKRGESDFVLAEPIELPEGTRITKVRYRNAVPDFSPYSIAEVKIPKMTDERYIHEGNFEQADIALAEYWSQIKYNDRVWTSADVKTFRENYPYKLTWHEMSNMESMQLVPYEVNKTFGHYGGVAEYKAMIGQKGEMDFD